VLVVGALHFRSGWNGGAGTVDVVGLAVMGTTLMVALRSTQRAALTPSLTAH
jgi:hypothetical protein